MAAWGITPDPDEVDPEAPPAPPLPPPTAEAVEAGPAEVAGDDAGGGLRSWKAIKSSKMSESISSRSSERGGDASYMTETFLEVEADVEVAD